MEQAEGVVEGSCSLGGADLLLHGAVKQGLCSSMVRSFAGRQQSASWAMGHRNVLHLPLLLLGAIALPSPTHGAVFRATADVGVEDDNLEGYTQQLGVAGLHQFCYSPLALGGPMDTNPELWDKADTQADDAEGLWDDGRLDITPAPTNTDGKSELDEKESWAYNPEKTYHENLDSWYDLIISNYADVAGAMDPNATVTLEQKLEAFWSSPTHGWKISVVATAVYGLRFFIFHEDNLNYFKSLTDSAWELEDQAEFCDILEKKSIYSTPVHPSSLLHFGDETDRSEEEKALTSALLEAENDTVAEGLAKEGRHFCSGRDSTTAQYCSVWGGTCAGCAGEGVGDAACGALETEQECKDALGTWTDHDNCPYGERCVNDMWSMPAEGKNALVKAMLGNLTKEAFFIFGFADCRAASQSDRAVFGRRQRQRRRTGDAVMCRSDASLECYGGGSNSHYNPECCGRACTGCDDAACGNLACTIRPLNRVTYRIHVPVKWLQNTIRDGSNYFLILNALYWASVARIVILAECVLCGIRDRTNYGGLFIREFSADEHGILVMTVFFFSLFAAQLVLLCAITGRGRRRCQCAGKRADSLARAMEAGDDAVRAWRSKERKRIPLLHDGLLYAATFATAALTLWMIHGTVFARNGIGLPSAATLADIYVAAFTIILAGVFVLAAKGFSLFRNDSIKKTTHGINFVILGGVLACYIILIAWGRYSGITPGGAYYIWETVPARNHSPAIANLARHSLCSFLTATSTNDRSIALFFDPGPTHHGGPPPRPGVVCAELPRALQERVQVRGARRVRRQPLHAGRVLVRRVSDHRHLRVRVSAVRPRARGVRRLVDDQRRRDLPAVAHPAVAPPRNGGRVSGPGRSGPAPRRRGGWRRRQQRPVERARQHRGRERRERGADPPCDGRGRARARARRGDAAGEARAGAHARRRAPRRDARAPLRVAQDAARGQQARDGRRRGQQRGGRRRGRGGGRRRRRRD